MGATRRHAVAPEDPDNVTIDVDVNSIVRATRITRTTGEVAALDQHPLRTQIRQAQRLGTQLAEARRASTGRSEP